MSHAYAPDGDRAGASYEDDLHAWSMEQARLIRLRRFDLIDVENVAEEILDVGRNQYDKLESALAVLLMHMLKWDHQPERRSRSWVVTIAEQRNRVDWQMRDNPSLKSRRSRAVTRGYLTGRLRAAGEMDVDAETLPEACPYDWDAITRRQFSLDDR